MLLPFERPSLSPWEWAEHQRRPAATWTREDVFFQSDEFFAALDALIAETGAAGVHWNRRYEPSSVARDVARNGRFSARYRNANYARVRYAGWSPARAWRRGWGVSACFRWTTTPPTTSKIRSVRR